MQNQSLEELDFIVVDDDEVSYQGFATALSDAGLQWLQATNGHQAVEIVMTNPTKLCVANMKLPDMSGIELMEFVKASRGNTLFYLLSDEYSVDDEKLARAAGATGYFSKPLDTVWIDICAAAIYSHSVRDGPLKSPLRPRHHHPPTPRANAKPLR